MLLMYFVSLGKKEKATIIAEFFNAVIEEDHPAQHSAGGGAAGHAGTKAATFQFGARKAGSFRDDEESARLRKRGGMFDGEVCVLLRISLHLCIIASIFFLLPRLSRRPFLSFFSFFLSRILCESVQPCLLVCAVLLTIQSLALLSIVYTIKLDLYAVFQFQILVPSLL